MIFRAAIHPAWLACQLRDPQPADMMAEWLKMAALGLEMPQIAYRCPPDDFPFSL